MQAQWSSKQTETPLRGRVTSFRREARRSLEGEGIGHMDKIRLRNGGRGLAVYNAISEKSTPTLERHPERSF